MSQIGTQKRLLTTFTNKLQHTISKLEQEKLADFSWTPKSSQDDLREAIRLLQEASKILADTSSKVEEKLNSYASTIDALKEPSTKDIEDYEECSQKAETAISQAFDLSTLLQARLHSLMNHATSSEPVSTSSCSTQLQPRKLELPPLPIPTFGGNLLEWENFWELFNNNIHSQDLPEMIKYNYLLNALEGQARDAIRKFQVTRGNYEKVIQFLHNKYNNKELLINQLIEQLDKCVLRSPSIEDQRSLLDEIQVIVTQLQENGENINSSWIIKKILSKFPTKIMRKAVIRRRKIASENSFTINDLIQLLDELLSTEELWIAYSRDTSNNRPPSVLPKANQALPRSCMYCYAEHSSFACTVYSTPQARSSYLRQKQLCLLCASPAHKTPDCKRRPCFNCNGLHHTSCCFKQDPSKRRECIPKETCNLAISAKSSDKSYTANKINKSINEVVSNKDASKGNALMQMALTSRAEGMSRPFLPTGEVTILHPRTRTLMKIDVLLDSGAEASFINSALAKELCLPVIKEEQMRLHTFASEEIRRRSCKLVELEIWDMEGRLHSLHLYTHDVITPAFARPQISESDLDVIRSLNIPIQHLHINKENSKPAILLGCDQIWSFIRTDTTAKLLPSGLVLLPTKLGYVVSGRANSTSDENHQEVLPISIAEDESKKWDNYWSMDFQVNTIASRDATYRMIRNQFSNSTEQSDDDCRVRPPCKKKHLVSNDHALGCSRLVNERKSLRNDITLPTQYHKVNKDQLHGGMVEPVADSTSSGASTIHYPPQQPAKTVTNVSITKISSIKTSPDYKKYPLRRDFPYGKPDILPSLYGLRIRNGTIPPKNDVEKAFLQIGSHGVDRDDNRCLWLRGRKKPPDKTNIPTFRSTHSTFKLRSCPFLQAGTTQYHLNKYDDNVIITSDAFQDSIRDSNTHRRSGRLRFLAKREQRDANRFRWQDNFTPAGV